MEVSWEEIGSHGVNDNADESSFWRALDIWWLKPHVVNRRLSAAIQEHSIPFASGPVTCSPPGPSAEAVGDNGVAFGSGAASSGSENAWRWLHSVLEDMTLIDFADLDDNSRTTTSIKECLDQHVSLLNSERNSKKNIDSLERNQIQNEVDIIDSSECDSISSQRTGSEIADAVTDKNKTEMCEVCVRKLLQKGAGCANLYEIGLFDHISKEATFMLLIPKADGSGEETGLSTKIILPSYKFSFLHNKIILSVSEDYLSIRPSPSSSASSSQSSSMSSSESPSLSPPSLLHSLSTSSTVSSSSSASLSSLHKSVPSVKWLKETLLGKIAKWAVESEPSQEDALRQKSLVPMERYTELYQEMKQKYGYKFVKMWPENTDPKKFVYEDVAIATYLLLLFEEERKASGNHGDERKQSFVDLGCGNGLLVHILNSEGYPGKGIDLRRRKIWDLYGPETNLEEGTIIPSMETSYEDYDWLIGNHSDELTPWIPVMAARSSFKTRYFVLPCCFHDFDRKFGQRKSGESQYRTYLNFVKDVGATCGFKVGEDRMRIPSTKRVCHVGRQRTYTEEDQPRVLDRIKSYVTARCKKARGSNNIGEQSSAKDDGSSHSLLISIDDADSPPPTPPPHPLIVESNTKARAQDAVSTVTVDSQTDGCRTTGSGRTHEEAEQGSTVTLEGATLELTVESGSKSEQMDCSRTSHCEPSEDARAGKSAGESLVASTTGSNLAPSFKPRDVEERVRNCSLVERSLQDRITMDVAWAILEAGGVRRPGPEEEKEDEDAGGRSAKSAKLWRRGGSVTLGEAAKLFDKETLKKLRSECGGLKTLLKNHNQVFQITGNQVELKDWDLSPAEPSTSGQGRETLGRNGRKTNAQELEKREKERKLLYKTKLCWFHSNHPDGCPRLADACPFAHGPVELRTRPSFGKLKFVENTQD